MDEIEIDLKLTVNIPEAGVKVNNLSYVVHVTQDL